MICANLGFKLTELWQLRETLWCFNQWATFPKPCIFDVYVGVELPPLVTMGPTGWDCTVKFMF